MKILFITGNAGKVKTASAHLAPLGITVEQVRLELDEIQSTSSTEVALHKAQQAFRVLKQPLIVEDSGFGIDELGGYPGPMVKHLLEAVGAEGIARLADQTTTRHCRFSSCLVYIDAHGVPRTWTNRGSTCTVADTPAVPVIQTAWSALWDVVIPEGCSAPLSALPDEERTQTFARWKETSNFRRFGESLAGKIAASSATPAVGDRIRSKELTFEFPPEQIASRPRPDGADRLLVVDRASGQLDHRRFDDLADVLPAGSLLVVNNSAVVRAALRRVPDDGTYLHITAPQRPGLTEVECLCPWKPEVGSTVPIRGGRFQVHQMPVPGRDLRVGAIVPDDPAITTLQEFMACCGEVPIPIYVNAQRDPDAADAADYQNVYASAPGSIACPTAGLHLSDNRIKTLREAGHDLVEVTLHIGYGTWKSLATEYVDEHTMDAETCQISAGTLTALRDANRSGRPIVAVGTSSVRTLETFAQEILTGTQTGPLRRDTTLYISPGFDFQITDHMITNFAYPQTPIMAMTTAFTGSWELLREAYAAAVGHGGYQFLTYGDAMYLR